MPLSQTLAKIIESRTQGLGRPVLVGLAGPQGSGKSTLAGRLSKSFPAAVLSLDDFYLTRLERQALAARAHPLFATRGPPGTHDLALLERAVGGLLAGRPVTVPQFDKALDDRAPELRKIPGPVDVILLEGWCVGALAVNEEELVEPINVLERESDRDGVWRRLVNDALAAYEPLFGRLDLLIQLRSPDFETVAHWRWEQEAKLRAERGGPQVMDEAGVRRFTQYYERITRQMLENPPGDVVIDLAANRSVISIADMRD